MAGPCTLGATVCRQPLSCPLYTELRVRSDTLSVLNIFFPYLTKSILLPIDVSTTA